METFNSFFKLDPEIIRLAYVAGQTSELPIEILIKEYQLTSNWAQYNRRPSMQYLKFVRKLPENNEELEEIAQQFRQDERPRVCLKHSCR